MLDEKQKEKAKDILAYTIWVCHVLITYALAIYLVFAYVVLPLWKWINGWGLPIIAIIYFVVVILTDKILKLINWGITRVNNDKN